MPSITALVEPSLLFWARKSANLEPLAAARKIGIPEGRVEAWEDGKLKPTIAQLRKAAHVYRRPLGVFFLPEPPQGFETMRDFRRIFRSGEAEWSAALHDEYRRAHAQRDALLELADLDGIEPPSRACLPYLWSFALQSDSVTTRDSRFRTFSDAEWERIEPLLPSNLGQRGHPFGDNRRVVEGIIYRYRTGIPWRDLPREEYGPWQTVWKRHRRYAGDGTWDQVLAQILAEADAAGKIDWTVSVDATITRAHQHATNTTRPEQDTGGSVELQESAARAG